MQKIIYISSSTLIEFCNCNTIIFTYFKPFLRVTKLLSLSIIPLSLSIILLSLFAKKIIIQSGNTIIFSRILFAFSICKKDIYLFTYLNCFLNMKRIYSPNNRIITSSSIYLHYHYIKEYFSSTISIVYSSINRILFPRF